MRRLQSFLLSSALLLAPVSVTAAFAQSNGGSQAPSTTSVPASSTAAPVAGGTSSTNVIPPAKNGPAGTGMVRKVSPDTAGAQLANPTGAEPGTGSGMGKVSGTAAGN